MMFDFGIDTRKSFFEGVWFIFFADGVGGIWADGVFYMGHSVGERGN